MTAVLERHRFRIADWAATSAAEVAAVALITLLAAGLRFYKLGEWSFWFDEVFNSNRALAHYSDLADVIRNLRATLWLPLSILLTGQTFNLLGVSEFSARLTPAVIGIVSIPALYVPTRRVLGSGVALASSLLLALAPWHLYWSQNARFYTALMLFYTLALFAFFFAFERDRPAYILLGFALLYLAASERLVALFLMPVLAAYLLLLWLLPYERPPGFNRRNLALLVLVPLGLLAAAELFSVATTGSTRFLSADFFSALGWFSQFRGSDPFKLLGYLSYNIGTPVLALAFFGGLYLIAEKRRVGLLLFLGACVPVILLLVLSTFTFTTDRYVFATLPTWLILAAAAGFGILRLANDRRTLLGLGVLTILVADAARLDLVYYQVNHGNRLDWRGALATVARESRAEDVYVSAWTALDSYYLGKDVLYWSNADVEQLAAAGKRIWFIIDSEAGWGTQEQWAIQNAELKNVYYLRTPYDTSLRIYLYDPERNSGPD